MANQINNPCPPSQASSSFHPEDILDDLIMEEALRDSQQQHATQPMYWCHQCEKEIQPSMPDFLCTSCGGAFIEEVPADKVDPRPSPTFSQPPPQHPQHSFQMQFGSPFFAGPRTSSFQQHPGPQPFMHMLSSFLHPFGQVQHQHMHQQHHQQPTFVQQQNPFVYTFVSSSYPPAPAAGAAPAPQGFEQAFTTSLNFSEYVFLSNAFILLLMYLFSVIRNLFSGLNGGGNSGNLDQMINQLFEASMNTYDVLLLFHIFLEQPHMYLPAFFFSSRCGPPPTAKSVRDALPIVQISQSHVGALYPSYYNLLILTYLSLVDNKDECAICKDEFALQEAATELPCTHRYHSGCILPWLESVCSYVFTCCLFVLYLVSFVLQRNSCPVCRFELPTDDADYEARRQQRQAQAQTQQAHATTPVPQRPAVAAPPSATPLNQPME